MGLTMMALALVLACVGHRVAVEVAVRDAELPALQAPAPSSREERTAATIPYAEADILGPLDLRPVW